MNQHNYKPGEMIEVRDSTSGTWHKLKFIGFHSMGQATTEDGDTSSTWRYHRSINAKRTRIMTGKELAGKWVKGRGYETVGFMVIAFRGDEMLFDGSWSGPTDRMLFTTTPADDSSWKSVVVNEGEEG